MQIPLICVLNCYMLHKLRILHFCTFMVKVLATCLVIFETYVNSDLTLKLYQSNL